jgi:hypothetical protein
MALIMTKEEKIQEAYKPHYEDIKNYIDDDGWCLYAFGEHIEIGVSPFGEYDIKCYKYWRPKSLQGIENNNGWIKIESEKDLPITDVDCHIVYNNNLMSFAVWDNLLKGFYIGIVKQNPSHYQPIIKPQPPIF